MTRLVGEPRGKALARTRWTLPVGISFPKGQLLGFCFSRCRMPLAKIRFASAGLNEGSVAA
jgi:hypothetical protein